MKKLGCKDMGVACDFVATGETAEDVKKMLVDHAMKEHKDMFDKMSQEEKDGMMKKMDKMIM